MSNGSGPIIIHAALSAPATTDADKATLQDILKRYEQAHKCSIPDAIRVCRIVWKLIR